ncbi:hypothetical protein [Methanobrevibacter sp.]|nr:hypothetical protein [uncultured Methanobrevibacter sp.]
MSKVFVGIIILGMIIIIKHLFLPKSVFSFVISLSAALILGFWIIS